MFDIKIIEISLNSTLVLTNENNSTKSTRQTLLAQFSCSRNNSNNVNKARY